MDDLVLQAMAKWPHVPHCYGWLGLDARGRWWMRDERAQAAGGFDSGQPGSKGAVLEHEKLLAFIARNYAADECGCWYFQNGPQRVFVELALTPLVWRVDSDGGAQDQCQQSDRVDSCLVDEHGHVYLLGRRGLGLVHTQDMGVASDLIEQGRWRLLEVVQSDLQRQFGFVRSPQSLQRRE